LFIVRVAGNVISPEVMGQNGLKIGVKLVGAVYDITTGRVRFFA
jgi:carbonic anhydrase